MVLGIINSAFEKTKRKQNSRSAVGWMCRCEWNRGIRRVNYIYWENPRISRPMQFKPVSFKGPLYFEKPSFYWRVTIPADLYQTGGEVNSSNVTSTGKTLHGAKDRQQTGGSCWGPLCHSGLTLISKLQTQWIRLYRQSVCLHGRAGNASVSRVLKRGLSCPKSVRFLSDWASFQCSKYVPSGSSLETSFCFLINVVESNHIMKSKCLLVIPHRKPELCSCKAGPRP